MSTNGKLESYRAKVAERIRARFARTSCDQRILDTVGVSMKQIAECYDINFTVSDAVNYIERRVRQEFELTRPQK